MSHLTIIHILGLEAGRNADDYGGGNPQLGHVQGRELGQRMQGNMR